MSKTLKTSRFLTSLSFKDVIALGLLLCTDYLAFIHDYARLPGRKPLYDYPFQEFRNYLSKLKDKRVSQISSYYRLKKFKVFEKNKDKVEINLGKEWWQDYFNLKFRFFVAPKKWNGIWTIVIFDIPEKNRQTRREIRYYLKHLGFVQWQRSVWVTINNVKTYVEKIFNNAQPYLFCFQAKSLFSDRDEEIIKKLFAPHQIEESYNQFIKKANLALKQNNYKQAKNLINDFPDTILKDRGVPGEFFKNPELRQKLYKKTKKLNQIVKNHPLKPRSLNK